MTSRLFHTVVSVGISLSAAAIGCASPTDAPAVSDESALNAAPAPAPAADCPDAGPNWDAFCDATWPTTKGAAYRAPECVDKDRACAGQDLPFECFPAGAAEGVCNGNGATYSVCVDGTWQCKPSRKHAQACTCFEYPGFSCADRDGGSP